MLSFQRDLLRRAGVNIPGVTTREKRPFTVGTRQQVLGRFQQRHHALLEAAKVSDDDLELMADDILRGYRNSGRHYQDFGRPDQPASLYQTVFARLSLDLDPFRWAPSGLERPRSRQLAPNRT